MQHQSRNEFPADESFLSYLLNMTMARIKKEDIDIKMRWSPELVHHHLDKVVLIYSPDTLILVMHAEKYVLDVVKVTG